MLPFRVAEQSQSTTPLDLSDRVVALFFAGLANEEFFREDSIACIAHLGIVDRAADCGEVLKRQCGQIGIGQVASERDVAAIAVVGADEYVGAHRRP